MTKFLRYLLWFVFLLGLFVLHHLPYLNLIFRTDVVLTLYFLFLSRLFRWTSTRTFLAGFLLLLISFGSIVFNNWGLAGQVANASYFIFIIGSGQWFWELVKAHKMALIDKDDIKQISHILSVLIPVIILMFLALIPRLILAANFFGTPDSINARDIVNVAMEGKNVYATGNYTYPPLWLNMMLFMKFFGLDFGLSYDLLWRLWAVLSDVAIVLLIYFSLKRQFAKSPKPFFLAFVYALSPVAILISGFHGQIDSIWILFSLLSWYIFEFYPTTSKNLISSSFLLSVGIALKVFPILFIPLFLMKMKERKNQLLFTILAVLPFVISMTGPFLTSFNYVFRSFVNYGIEHNFWGISAVAAFIYYHFPSDKSVYYLYRILTTAQIERLPLYGFLVFLYIFLYVYKKQFALIQGMFLIILGLLIMTPFISVQWWIWPIPFAILLGNTKKYFWYYTIPITLVLISRYFLYFLNIPEELRPSFIHARETIKGIKIDSGNKIIAFGVWLILWKWLVVSLRDVTKR